jgi:ribonuclease HI
LEKLKKETLIWTDGSVYPHNPGSGGWGVFALEYIRDKPVKIVKIRGSVKAVKVGGVSSVRAELVAVVEALDRLDGDLITLYTDSKYIIDGVERLQRGSMLGSHTDMWKRLKDILENSKAEIDIRKVKGHTNIYGNDQAHSLAFESAKEGSYHHHAEEILIVE